MKKIIIYITTLIVCFSCKEDVVETLHILIQNKTDSSFHITLYPKEAYQHEDLYLHSDIGGGYTETEFTLSPNSDGYYDWEEVLFVSNDLNIQPDALTSKVFDSIHISTVNKDKIISFTPEDVIGYSENIFSGNSNWDYKEIEDEKPTMGGHNPQNYHCYTFLISEDNFVISNATE